MRRLTAAVLLLAAAGTPGCRRLRPAPVVTEESMGPLLPVVAMADPRGAVQLLRGFHELENESWRWSASRFAVALVPPPEPAPQGLALRLEGALPESIFARTGPVTLAVALDGKAVGSWKIEHPGPVALSLDLPVGAVPATGATVTGTLDHFLPPAPAERRELGLIVASLGLYAK